MCHFVTLIAPTADVDALRKVMKKHGRAAEPIDNPSVRSVLQEGELQYLTTSGHCDCGTALAPRHANADTFEHRIAAHAERMRRKGWSGAKISRALDGMRKADARPQGGGGDSIELWNAVLNELRQDLGLRYAGLMVRDYRGGIATEAFRATRRRVDGHPPWNEALGAMEHDEVTVFPLSASR